MRTRVLLGVGAWLLGATMATAGSLYAVGQLGNSLFAVPSKPLTVRMVNADLTREHPKAATPSASAKPGHRRTGHGTRPDKSRPSKHRASPSQSPTPTSTPTPSSSPPTGVFLSSADGSVQAVCEAGGAYLLYWTPAAGYEASNFNQGPAAVAYVAFTNDFGGIMMRVTCQGGVPVKHLSRARDE